MIKNTFIFIFVAFGCYIVVVENALALALWVFCAVWSYSLHRVIQNAVNLLHAKIQLAVPEHIDAFIQYLNRESDETSK